MATTGERGMDAPPLATVGPSPCSCRICGESTGGLLLCAGHCRDRDGWDLEVAAAEHERLDLLTEALVAALAQSGPEEMT